MNLKKTILFVTIISLQNLSLHSMYQNNDILYKHYFGKPSTPESSDESEPNKETLYEFAKSNMQINEVFSRRDDNIYQEEILGDFNFEELFDYHYKSVNHDSDSEKQEIYFDDNEENKSDTNFIPIIKKSERTPLNLSNFLIEKKQTYKNLKAKKKHSNYKNSYTEIMPDSKPNNNFSNVNLKKIPNGGIFEIEISETNPEYKEYKKKKEERKRKEKEKEKNIKNLFKKLNIKILQDYPLTKISDIYPDKIEGIDFLIEEEVKTKEEEKEDEDYKEIRIWTGNKHHFDHYSNTP